MIRAPGIFFDMEPTAYLADPAPAPSFTQSIAKVLLDHSPAHARLAHPRLAPPATEDDDAEKYDKTKAIGDAAHAVMLGRGKRLAVESFDSWRGKAADVRAAHAAAGRTPILSKHMARAYAMVEAAHRQLNATPFAGVFGDKLGDSEVVLAWREGDLWLRAMVDWLPDDRRSVWDLKTTAMSCAPHAVEDRPSVMGWDIQAAMHERGLDVLDPNNAGRRKHFFVNQENEPPYGLTIIEISEADLTMGRKKLAMAFDIWSRCMATNAWPGYPAETVISRPRGFLESKFLEREIAHHERREREPMLTDMSGG